jgi:predicted dehydrogenase
MKPVTIGIVGAGFVAHIHAHAYQGMHDLNVHLGGITSLSLPKAEAFAHTYGITTVYPSLEELLARSEINVVDLCVPNHLHAPFTIAAARAGKHIICEKPFTGYFGSPEAREPIGTTPKKVMLQAMLATGEQMLSTACSHGVKLMYAENWLYMPAFQKALRLANAAGGTILEIRAQECHSGSHAAYAKEWRTAGGGALLRLGAHPLGAALYLKQQEGLRRVTGYSPPRPIRVQSVMAETSDLSRVPSFQAEARHWLVTGWQDVENWATVILTFEDGTHATVHAADTVLGGMEDTFEILLSNGRIACDMTHSTMLRAYAPDPAIFAEEYIAEKLETKAGWSHPALDEEWLLGYPQELRDFIGAVSEDRAPLSDGRLGLEVARVIYAAYQSAEEGRRVWL